MNIVFIKRLFTDLFLYYMLFFLLTAVLSPPHYADCFTNGSKPKDNKIAAQNMFTDLTRIFGLKNHETQRAL